MSLEIIIDKFGIGNAVVIRDDSKIIDYFFDPPQHLNSFYPPQTFLLGKISRIFNELGGCFIKLPNGKEGFLVTKKNYKEGDTVKVMSRVFYEAEKPQRFSDKLRIVSDFCIIEEGVSKVSISRKVKRSLDIEELKEIVAKEPVNLVLRSKVFEKSFLEIKNKVENALEQYKLMLSSLDKGRIFYYGLAKSVALERFDNIRAKIYEEEGIFESLGIWDQLQKIFYKKISFGNGSYIYIENTKAMCVIDVNSGKDLKFKAHEINIHACDIIYGLVRQRGLGGKIVIDFLPISKSFKMLIYRKLQKLFSKDIQKTKIWGWTQAGNFEIERERDKTPINLVLEH